uniref:Zf-CCHC domain-containing protein/RVP_2 domain-containing protein n=1 Tax=Tanacetum cinerariifolium TaxID=118510 RepID=A0A699KB91_TANCI|nr:zf-CCHC domain-containing protein/RVP_2 domain-containing protein [Tanacetum cinerariifolium]GFA85785.1 zf-CCHC domain-containing protein/RVP_2 domain-containing protein [Tanacetum cinerariifolium]
MQQVQVNTKFLNALPSKWRKFVTDVKLAKSLYPTNYDQLYAYLSQHEQHANEQGEYSIECINKAMPFLSAATSRNRGIATTLKGNFTASQPRVVKCYNCQEEGHMVRQCTQPKMPRIAAWFKEKLMLAEAQEAGRILDQEQLAFLADPGILKAPVAQQTISQNLAFQTEDLDAYDSDCDDLSSAKAGLMANLSRCDLEVLTEDTISSAHNDLLVLSLVDQMTDHVAHLDKENQTNKMVNESLTIELGRYKEQVTIFEQRVNIDLNKREKLIDSQMDDLDRDRNEKLAAFQQEIDTLKQTLSNNVKEKESLSKTLTVFKT